MSDFDKEAEREKLREKYERDKAEREATQRMSDLLLKGATMTNMHCGTCGDPLFQQDGTTFCPSCHGNPDAVEGTDLEAQPAEESAGAGSGDAADPANAGGSAAGDASSQSIDVESPAEAGSGSGASADASAIEGASADETAGADSSSADGQDRSASASGERGSESADPARHVQRAGDVRTPPSQSASQSQGGAGDRDDSDSHSQSAAAERRSVGRRGRSTRRAAASPPVDGDLESARESLVQAVEKFAGEAAATDDPRYAKECLEAAREAGEALSTLR
ncbi:Sjogren's syndrome/scleroderma autoantigen 1 family protein [Halopiger thermotolerans]